MADTVAVYKADPQIAKLLKDAAKTDRPLRVETDSETYELRVHRKGAPLRRVQDYDPERAREALRRSFGILSDLDAEAFIAEMKANRE